MYLKKRRTICNAPHVDEVLLSLVRRAIIRHTTLIDDTYFVKVLVQRFSRLIDGDGGGLLEMICSDPQRTDKLQSGASVKTTGGTGVDVSPSITEC